MFSSSLGVVPSPPHARAGVRCAPREEFDVTPLPKPTVILVSAGAHSSLDEEAISDAFLQSLRRKDEEAAERYAAMQAVLSAVAEPLQVSTAPHLSSSACRCEACAMKLGGTESAVVDKPKLARPSTGTAIRPHRKPLTSIDAPDVAPKVVRPKSGAPTHAHRKPAVVIVQDRPSLPLSAPPSARGMRGAKVPWTPILSSGPVLTVTSVRPFASPSHVPAPSSAAPVGLRDNCWTTDAGGARKMPESLQDVASRLSVMGDGPETLSGSPMAGPISRVLLSRRGNKHKASSTRSRSTRTAGR